MLRVLICVFGPPVPSLLLLKGQSFPTTEPSHPSVFWILSFFLATFDCWLSLHCLLETQVCFSYPLYVNESQIYPSSQAFSEFQTLHLPPPILRVWTINVLCEGHAPSYFEIIHSTCSLPSGKLFSPLYATITHSHPSSPSSNFTSSGRPDYLMSV